MLRCVLMAFGIAIAADPGICCFGAEAQVLFENDKTFHLDPDNAHACNWCVVKLV